MSKLTKTMLALSVIGLATGFLFVTGLVKVGDEVGLYVALPMGAIFFGLFLISKMLEKEVAQHDAEMRTSLEAAGKPESRKPCCEEAAHSHEESLASVH